MHPIFVFISGGELLIVLLVFLLLFGSSKIPDLAKGLGKGLREFKKATDDIKREINNTTGDITRDISESTKSIRQNISQITSEITTDINRSTDEINRNLNAPAGNDQPAVADTAPEKNQSTGDIQQSINEITDNIGT